MWCDDVAAGRLEVVLPQIRLPASPLHAHSRLAAAKVRICVDFPAAKLKQQWAGSVQGSTRLSVPAGDDSMVSDVRYAEGSRRPS
jgi:hypothetical protein